MYKVVLLWFSTIVVGVLGSVLSSSDQTTVITALNEIRSMANSKQDLPDLTWNDTLAATANAWNSQCKRSSNNRNKVLYSEIYGFAQPDFYNTTGIQGIINQWNAEQNNNAPTDRRNYTSITFFRTTRIGCALQDCGDWVELYCLASNRSWNAIPPFDSLPAVNCSDPANVGQTVQQGRHTVKCPDAPPVPEFHNYTKRAIAGCMAPIACANDQLVRDLSGAFTSSTSLTLEQCKGFCVSKGYKYMGVQVGTQCFCGNSYLKYGYADFGTKCNMKMSGDSLEWSGGPFTNLIYDVSNCVGGGTCDSTSTPGQVLGSFVGCYQFQPKFWPNAYAATVGSVSVGRCSTYCTQQGYPYAGIYGASCFCGLSAAVTATRNDFQCNLGSPPFIQTYGISGCYMMADVAKFDWREYSPQVVAPVRDQGQCGSCYAHAAVEVLESRFAIAHATNVVPIMLSVNQVIMCSGQNGCSGGDPASAAGNFGWPKWQGINCAAAVGDDSLNAWASCSKPQTACRIVPGATQTIRYSNWQAMIALLAGGPIVATIEAGWDLQSYSGGIYSYGSQCQNLANGYWPVTNHAIVIDGWGVAFDGTPYWLVRNSWGNYWGESGYFRIKMGANICNIESLLETINSQY